jgi:murein DD-endopeptidase MepM/ murein hydrolase activator NlpD
MAARSARVLAVGVVLATACSGGGSGAGGEARPPSSSVSPSTVPVTVAPVPAATAPATTGTTAAASGPIDPPTTTAVAAATFVPDGVDPDSPCLERAVFGDPGDSPYRLPFHVGEWYLVTQSYCLSAGGHRNQLAYDFGMPIGRDVLAARAGVVRDVRQDSPDDGRGRGEHNYVFVEHNDGTVAFYAHLMQDSVVVAVGDTVAAGDVMASSGNSGLTGTPHLHFGVYRWWPPQEGFDVPVSFANASGRLDARGGLIEGLVYEALPAG